MRNLFRQTSLQPVPEVGWRSGLANLWHKESQRWWQSWPWQLLIWVPLLDGFTAIAGASSRVPASRGTPPSPGLLVLVLLFFTVFPAFGTVIIAHGKLLDEQQSGTVVWVLSKPVTRAAFVLSKFASVPGLLLSMTVIPGAIAYLLVWLFKDQIPSPMTFVSLLSLAACFVLFFFNLMLLLGVLLQKRAAILGLGIFVAFIMEQLLFQGNLLAGMLVNQVPLLLLAAVVLLVGALLCFLLTLARFARAEF